MKKVLRVTGRILSMLLTVLLVTLTVFTIYIIYGNAHGRVAEFNGHSVLKVVTGSMEPSIYVGDYIYIEKVDTKTLQVGDIISFYSEDKSIYDLPNTHRIIGIEENGYFVTKGDANETKDSILVKPDRVIGKYTGKARFFKWISSFASAKKLLLLLAVLPLLGVSIYEVVTITKIKIEIDEEKSDKLKEEKERLIQEAVEKEKQRLYEEAAKKQENEKSSDENGGEDS